MSCVACQAQRLVLMVVRAVLVRDVWRGITSHYLAGNTRPSTARAWLEARKRHLHCIRTINAWLRDLAVEFVVHIIAPEPAHRMSDALSRAIKHHYLSIHQF